MSDSLRPHELQHARPPYPSPTPGSCSKSCPLHQWCHPMISSSVLPFSSHLQSFPTSVSFPMSQLFTSGGQSIGISASTSALPMNTQDWSPLGWTHWKRLWWWEGLGAGGEGDDRGWDGWMASLTQWRRVWVNSGSWWWTGRPGVLQFMGSQRVGHDWATELNWLKSNESKNKNKQMGSN